MTFIDSADGSGRHLPAGSSSIELRQLRAFVALVESGSITAAARTIGVAQSTASEALASLERALGVPVAEQRRGSRRVRLTEAGEALLPHARRAIAAVEEGRAAVARAAERSRSTVAIVANESVCTYLLPAALAALRHARPNTRFEVTVATCDGVRIGVGNGGYDLGLLLDEAVHSAPPPGHPERRAVRQTILDDVALVVFGRPDHPLARGPRRLPRGELAPFPLHLSDAAGNFHTLVRDYFESDGLPGPPLAVTGSTEGVKRGVAADPQALGVLPAYAVAAELAGGDFRALQPSPAPPRMRLDALVPAGRAAHPAVTALLESLRAGSAEPGT